MIAWLYRYPHPTVPGVWLYCGQERVKGTRHKIHNRGKTSFGRKWQKTFPGIPMPEPTYEQTEAQDQQHLNAKEHGWFYQYGTLARDYEWGMNLIPPGSQDYKEMGCLGMLVMLKNLTTEQRRENGRQAAATIKATLTSEQNHEKFVALGTASAQSLTFDYMSERGRKGAASMNAAMTPEQKARRNAAVVNHLNRLYKEKDANGKSVKGVENSIRMCAAVSSEQHREYGRKGGAAANAVTTFEQRSERGRKGASVTNAALTLEQMRVKCSKAGLACMAIRTPEQNRKMLKKGRCTRWYINRGLSCVCGHHFKCTKIAA